jgi:hypothetical protein
MALSCAVTATPAHAVDAPVAVTQLSKVRPPEVQYLWAGASGFGYRLPERPSTPAVWVDYTGAVPSGPAGPDDLATGADVVSTKGTGTVAQKHRSTGATATVTLPEGHAYKAAVGWSVVTQDAAGALHVLRAAADGTTRDLPVTGLPPGAEPTGTVVTGGSVRRAAVVYRLDGAVSTTLVDLADGTAGVSAPGSTWVTFNDRWLSVNGTAIRVDAAPGTRPAAVAHFGKVLAIVGDQLLSGNSEFLPVGEKRQLTATDLGTGDRRTVLTDSHGAIVPTSDGGALATAGPVSADWHIHRVTATADGGVTAARVQTVPAFRAAVDGMMLAGGELLMNGNVTDLIGYDSVQAMPLDAAGRPTGPHVLRGRPVNVSRCLGGDAACPQLEALGDGRYAYLSTDPAGTESVHVGTAPNAYASAPTGGTGGRLGTGTGRYVLYNGGTPGTQKVADFARGADGEVVLSRTRTAAAVWGQRLWIPGGAPGQIVAHDLKAKRNVATVDTGAPCTPSEIQAVNAWLYWTCGTAGPAGVYDRAADRAITVPAGQARLADGYLVRENRTTRELLLTDFHTGTATTRTVAVLPAVDQNTGGHTGRWAVDRFGGHLAHLTADGQVALVTSGVPTSPLARTEAQTEAGPGPTTAAPWQPVWQLNKPSTWTLSLSDAAGTVVRTLGGASTAAAVRASWNGLWGDGRRVAGTYTWKLTAEPRDGHGPGLALTGTTTVN